MSRQGWGLDSTNFHSRRRTLLDDGKKLTGKNLFTELAVTKLQIFYRLAIRINENNLQAMRQDIFM